MVRFVICALAFWLMFLPARTEAAPIVAHVFSPLKEGFAVVPVKGGKITSYRPAPRQNLQRAPQRAQPKAPARAQPRAPARVQKAPRQEQGMARKATPSRPTPAKAAPAKAASAKAPPARVANPKGRLDSLRSRQASATRPATTPAPAQKALTKARLSQVSASLKSAAKSIRMDKSLNGHRVIAGGSKAFDQVPAQYRAQVKASFQGEVRAVRLTRPMVVQRRYGGGAGESGSPYYTRQSYGSAALAKLRLALPRSNTAQNRTTHVIPAGSVILVGRTAPQQAGKVFGVGAKGGDEQIYVVNPKGAFSLKITGGLRP